MFIYLTYGLVLGLPAAAQPGPFQAYLLAQTVKNGSRRTLPAALAPLLSDGPIIILVLLVLTQFSSGLLRSIKVAGGLFLIYLALRAARALWRHARELEPANGEGARQSLLEAAVMNFLNPLVYIFWSFSAGPLLAQAWQESAAHGLSFLAGFYGMLVGGLMLFIIFSGVVGRLDARISRALTALSVVALAGFGSLQLWQGIAGGT
ncbi:MAG: LysE family transporter [Candidatus Promineifilaceae bacterium]|nr:LysE family transporter [Candidatus Promineifilaceae bacterium]